MPELIETRLTGPSGTERENGHDRPERMADEQAGAVSIVLATFNGERYLEPLLESLADQTIAPRELVVGDDGSQDRTPEIVSEFARRAPFPVTFTQNERPPRLCRQLPGPGTHRRRPIARVL